MVDYAYGPRQRLAELAGPPAVRVMHPFDGLQENNYGNGIVIEPDTTRKILRSHGRDGLPHAISISCGYQFVDNPDVEYADVAPVGILTFGAGGMNTTIEFDFTKGLVFNINATSFDLEVRNEAFFPPDLLNRNRVSILAQASMGVGGAGRSSSNPLRRSFNLGVVPNNGSVGVVVPNGATSFNMFGDNPAGLGAVVISQRLGDNPNSAVISRTTNPSSDTGIGSMPLLGSTRSIEFRNTGAPIELRVMFSLAF